MSQLLVSVLMTAFNREQYIGEAIESVLASTYKNLELIIVDDCSTDNTVNIAKSFSKKDNRVQVYVNEKNLGDYPNRNCAASYANGTYIKYLDSDDTIYPWGLEAMMYCMLKYPDAGYGLMCHQIDFNNPLPSLLSPEDTYRKYFFYGSLLGMGPSGAIIKRSAFNKVTGFSGIPYIGDIEIWLRLSQKEKLVCMPGNLVWWREHEGQQIKQETKFKDFEKLKLLTYKNLLIDKDCPLNNSDACIAIRNQINIRSRNILKQILQFRFRTALSTAYMFNVKFSDLIKSTKKNQVPIE